jgi:hypothetical protein
MRPPQYRLLGLPRSQSARLLSQPTGNLNRVDADLLSPRTLVAGSMHRPMMPAAMIAVGMLPADVPQNFGYVIDAAQKQAHAPVRSGRSLLCPD